MPSAEKLVTCVVLFNPVKQVSGFLKSIALNNPTADQIDVSEVACNLTCFVKALLRGKMRFCQTYKQEVYSQQTTKRRFGRCCRAYRNLNIYLFTVPPIVMLQNVTSINSNLIRYIANRQCKTLEHDKVISFFLIRLRQVIHKSNSFFGGLNKRTSRWWHSSSGLVLC